MRRRASLTMLMGFVAILAVCLAAMKVATDAAMRASFALGFLSLLTSTLGAVVRRGGAWIGFALFGWAYVLAALSPPIRDTVEPVLKAGESIDQIIAWLHPRVLRPAPQPPFVSMVKFDDTSKQYRKMSGLGSGDPLVPLSSSEQKQWDVWEKQCDAYDGWQVASYCGARICHVVAALVLACLGALAGHLLDDRSRQAGMSSEPPTPSMLG